MLTLESWYNSPLKHRSFLKGFRSCRVDRSNNETTFLLPEGTIEIVFQLGAVTDHFTSYTYAWEKRPVAFVGGLHDRAYSVKGVGEGRLFSVCFQPSSFSAFCKIPVHYLKNQLVGLEDIWGKEGLEWSQKILEAQTDQERIFLSSTFLETRYCSNADNNIRSLVFELENCQDTISTDVRELANCSSYSLSRFRQLFKEVTGISPKEYLKIRRINQAFQLQSKFSSLTALANHLGYHDQAHFIHDCKKITGLSPKNLFAVLYKEAFMGFTKPLMFSKA